jgi:hypothetical protein
MVVIATKNIATMDNLPAMDELSGGTPNSRVNSANEFLSPEPCWLGKKSRA